jgi:hypothetical protein
MVNPGQSAEFFQSCSEIRPLDLDVGVDDIAVSPAAITMKMILIEKTAGGLLHMEGTKNHKLLPSPLEMVVGVPKELRHREALFDGVDPISKVHGIRKGHGWPLQCLPVETGGSPGSSPFPSCRWTSVFHL